MAFEVVVELEASAPPAEVAMVATLQKKRDGNVTAVASAASATAWIAVIALVD